MKADATEALCCLVTALTREMACHWARLAYERGATQEQLTEAWAAWGRLQQKSVQVIRSRPS